jgi:DNA-binding NarL/FixJ family response regulator
VKKTRVALIDMRPRLREIVAAAVAREADLEIVSTRSSGTNADLEQLAIDVVIAGTQNPDDCLAPAELLAVLPRSRILMVAGSGRRAVVYKLRPEKLSLGDISTESLVNAIRGSATEPWRPIGQP